MHGNLSGMDLLKMFLPLQLGLACLIGLLFGKFFLPFLKKIKVGQEVREDGPSSHFVKSGTSTFGGFIFLVPVYLLALLTLLFSPLAFKEKQVFLFFFLGMSLFGGIGFADDYIKVRISKEGLSFRMKSLLQILSAIFMVLAYYWLTDFQPYVFLPWQAELFYIKEIWLLPYALFLVIYLYFCINAVNITDGVDGLSSMVTIVASLFLLALAFFVSQHSFLFKKLTDPNYFSLLSGSMWWLKWMIGALLAYFFFNRYPAKCFMGDLGSLSMGFYISGVVLLLGMPWFMLFFGFIYVVEALSVVIQVSYYKMTKGKRIFLMSPIHHHFEQLGWKETKIVIVFALVQFVASLLGMFLYLLLLFRLH